MHIVSWSQQIIATFLSVASGTRAFEFILQKQVTLYTTTCFFLGHKVDGCLNATVSNACAYPSIHDNSLMFENNRFKMIFWKIKDVKGNEKVCFW